MVAEGFIERVIHIRDLFMYVFKYVYLVFKLDKWRLELGIVMVITKN